MTSHLVTPKSLTLLSLQWITVFPPNRKRVLLDRSSSDSIPWALVFLLYINNLQPSTLNTTGSLIFRPINTIDNSRLLQYNLATLELWENVKSYNLHVIFMPPTPCTTTLSSADTFRYLGRHSFNIHMDVTIQKANKTLGFLRRTLQNCTTDTINIAYQDTWGGAVWCGG